MNNEMTINELLEEYNSNENIKKYEDLMKQKEEEEEKILESYELSEEEEEKHQKQLEKTQKEMQELEQKMTAEEQQLMKETDKLIDDAKRNVAFLAASTLIMNGDSQGTKSGESLLESSEQFAQFAAPIVGSELLMDKVREEVPNDVWRKFADNVSHPDIENALQIEQGDKDVTIGELIQSNEDSHRLMEEMMGEKTLESDMDTSYAANILFATYVQNGQVNEIAKEAEMSERQLNILAKKIIEDGIDKRDDVDFICEKNNLTEEQAEYVVMVTLCEKLKNMNKDEVDNQCKEWDLTENQKNIVVEAVVKGNEVKIGQYDYHTGKLDKSPLTSAKLQQAENVAGVEIDPKDNTRVGKPQRGGKPHKGAEYGD